MHYIRCLFFRYIVVIRFHLNGILAISANHLTARSETRIIHIRRIGDCDRLVMNHILDCTYKSVIRSALIWITCIRIRT